MNRIFSWAAMLCIAMLFSCTEVQRDNPWDEHGTNYKGSSSSDKPSSSSSARVSSSSSKPSSSSYAAVLSSSSTPSSSSSPYRLVCEVTVDTGIADEPIYEYDMPEVICIENKSKDEFILEPEYDFQWVNAPNWDAPKAGTYSKIQVKVNNDAEVCRGLTATCSGTLTILKGSSSSAVPSSSSSSSIQINIVYGDPVNYEGETYKTVVIGTQTWFQRNLNYDVAGSKCNENSTANCNEYGRLYNWRTAMVVCPSGWHLPSDAEWTVLVDFVGGTYTAGTKLKATSGWNFINEQGNGTDMYGFSALPGAYGNPGGGFSTVGYGGCWWSATTEYSPHYWQMYAGVSVIDNLSLNQDHLMSVRCIQD